MNDEPDGLRPSVQVVRAYRGRGNRMKLPAIGVFVCACGHLKASHRPHGGRRVPLSNWICRKKGCGCKEYGKGGVTVEFLSGRRCIGFGAKEGKCSNAAGTPWTKLWCPECDEARRAYLSERFEEIRQRFAGRRA